MVDHRSDADQWFDLLTNGPDASLEGLPTGTGDSAGIFTIWYRDELVEFGLATDTAETKPSNFRQADGVRGRVRGLTRQPGRPLQRRLQALFLEDWAASGEQSDQKRAAELLRSRGRCRIVRFESGDAAHAALQALEDRLGDLRGG